MKKKVSVNLMCIRQFSLPSVIATTFLPMGYWQKMKAFILQTLLPFLLSVVFSMAASAHPSPNSLVFLDVSPGRVAMEIQLPLPELELVFPSAITNRPETLIERADPQLKEYILAHVHAYITQERPWQVTINSLEISKGEYIGTNVLYREIVAHLILLPQPGESTRKFTLSYDVIMHQVVTHTALLSLRSDWENGTTAEPTAEAGVIRYHLSDNTTPPVEINLEPGSRWRGFRSMFGLGAQHIREGTDHLLFLLVLLLPSMLLLNGSRWGRFGGVTYSARKLLTIVTAFTIGHSITLLISAAGWIKLPSQPVEILIAFSILYQLKIRHRLGNKRVMNQINYGDQIKESATELYALERKASAAIVRDRLRFLRLLKSGAACSPPQAGEAVNFKRAWSYQLWSRYLTKGLSALGEYPFKGTRPRLDTEKAAQFKAGLAKDDSTTLADAVHRLENEYGITYTIGGMCYVMKRLGIKKKTGRPSHIHKDEAAVEAFKKKHRN